MLPIAIRRTRSIAPILITPALFIVPTPRKEVSDSLIPAAIDRNDAPKGRRYLRLRPENVLRTTVELIREKRSESSFRESMCAGPRDLRDTQPRDGGPAPSCMRRAFK